MKYINILFPVYNERLRLENGITKTIAFMDEILPDGYQLTIVDNASDDDTPQIAKALCGKYPQVVYFRLKEKGVGIAFRKGIAENSLPIVGYMDVDLSTDITHLKDVVRIFESDESIDIINASRLNKQSNMRGRKWYRIVTSKGLTILLKIFLRLQASDSICGFKFFRKTIVENLIMEAGADENGWFYIIEILLRAERNGTKIYELPVRWIDDHHSTVNVFSQIKSYCTRIFSLRRKFKEEGKKV